MLKVVVEFSLSGRHKAWEVVIYFVKSYRERSNFVNYMFMHIVSNDNVPTKISEAISKQSNTLGLAEKTVFGSVRDSQS